MAPYKRIHDLNDLLCTRELGCEKLVHRRDARIVLIWCDVLFLFAFQNKRRIYRYYPSCCECYSNCVHPLPYFPFPFPLERTHILQMVNIKWELPFERGDTEYAEHSMRNCQQTEPALLFFIYSSFPLYSAILSLETFIPSPCLMPCLIPLLPLRFQET